MRGILLLILTLSSISSFAQTKEAPYVILISFDGFRYDYVSKFNPTFFREFIRKGVAADGLIPSFPSKTFPNHYTLVTGMYPGHHGLVVIFLFIRPPPRSTLFPYTTLFR